MVGQGRASRNIFRIFPIALLLLAIWPDQCSQVMTGATVAWSDQAESDADWRLALRIRQVLALDPDLGPLNLGVEVRSRVVTLSGPVPPDWFRRRAEELVRATNGVRSVRNELMVRDSIPLPDSRLRQTPPLDGDAWPRWIGPLQRRATFLGVSSHSGVPSQAPLVRPPAATSAGSRNEAADVPQAYLASRVEAEPQRRCEAACQAGESDLEFAVRLSLIHI